MCNRWKVVVVVVGVAKGDFDIFFSDKSWIVTGIFPSMILLCGWR